MEAEEFITLLDSYWFFGQEIFKKNSSFPQNQDVNNSSKPHIYNQSSIHKRSQSDQLMIKQSPHDDDEESSSSNTITSTTTTRRTRRRESRNSPPTTTKTKKKKKKPLSKSLSELEFEEVKGFMDLGFVFKEEDRETSLVEIIPGLQRIVIGGGNKEEETTTLTTSSNCDNVIISRPYLSEAWDVDEDDDDNLNEENPLMHWRIPSVINDEIDMKDNLKWWAQAVASTVIR